MVSYSFVENCSQSWSITTYSVFGEECLQDDRSSSATCQTTMVVESVAETISLSVSLAEMTCVLGPIQEFLARVANLSVLRCNSHSHSLSLYNCKAL